MNNPLIAKSPAISNEISTQSKVDKILLLDGRTLDIQIGKFTHIYDRDDNSSPLYFDILKPTNRLHLSIYQCIRATLSTHSISYNCTTLYALKNWIGIDQMDSIDHIELSNLNSLLKLSSSYRPFILPLLRRIKEQLLPGLSKDVEQFLANGHKWEEKGNGAYYTLVTNDPISGALTDQEIHNVQGALNRDFASGKISQPDFTLCWFFIGTGVRPVQVRRMRKGDVCIHSKNGLEVTLKIPLAKGEKTAVDEHWIRRAPTVLAECLINYLNSPEMLAVADDAPLFNGSSGSISNKITYTIGKLDTYSQRLEGKIPITPYRFRYTMATRALTHGASDYEVARLLTHRSTSCIQFYRASMPELQKPVREALGQEMDYFARAFQGRMISSLNDATRSGEDEAVIADFLRLMGDPLGACGTRAECHQHAPVACLACPYFEPLIDAPWEQLFASLKEDQEREKELRIRQINHNAMSAILEIMAMRDAGRIKVVNTNG